MGRYSVEYFEKQDWKLLRNFLIIITSLLIFYVIRSWFLRGQFITIELVMLSLSLFSWWLLKLRMKAIAAAFISWVVGFGICGIYLLRPEVNSPALLWAIAFPLLSISFNGVRHGVIQSAVIILAMTIIGVLKRVYTIEFHEFAAESALIDTQVNLVLAPLTSIVFICLFFQNKKRALETIIFQQKELREALLDKKKVCSILYHDFSNLITAIDGRVGMALSDRWDLDRRFEHVERAHKSVQVMKELVTQVKYIESMKDGKTKFEMRPTSILNLCEKLEMIFQQPLKDKNIVLNLSKVDDIFVMAEPVSLLSCVLSNIVSNSIKFSKEGGMISISAFKENEKVIIVCRDTGLGIPADRIAKLFSMEDRTTTTGTEGELGSGYGLPVANEIMKLHKGKIEISSSTEKNSHGTTFRLMLRAA